MIYIYICISYRITYTCVLIAVLGGTAPIRVSHGRFAVSPAPLLQGGGIVSAHIAAIGVKLMMTLPKTEALAAVDSC